MYVSTGMFVLGLRALDVAIGSKMYLLHLVFLVSGQNSSDLVTEAQDFGSANCQDFTHQRLPS